MDFTVVNGVIHIEQRLHQRKIIAHCELKGLKGIVNIVQQLNTNCPNRKDTLKLLSFLKDNKRNILF